MFGRVTACLCSLSKRLNIHSYADELSRSAFNFSYASEEEKKKLDHQQICILMFFDRQKGDVPIYFYGALLLINVLCPHESAGYSTLLRRHFSILIFQNTRIYYRREKSKRGKTLIPKKARNREKRKKGKKLIWKDIREKYRTSTHVKYRCVVQDLK